MLTLTLLLLSANPAPVEPSVVKAREAFAAAQKLYQQARYADAAAKFEEAYAIRPHPTIQYNIGRCLEQLGDLPRAMRSYRDYLRLMPDAPDKNAVNASVANLERKLQDKGVQQVLVYAEPANAVITVDGKTLGGSPSSVELPPGNHTVNVTAAGHEPMQRSFVLSAQRSIELSFSLKSTSPVVAATDKPVAPVFTPNEFPPPPPPLVSATTTPLPRKPRLFTWLAGGAALAAAGTSVGLYAAANGEVVQLRAMERPGAEQQKYVTRAESLQTGSTVAAAIAGGAAVTALVLFFVEGS